MVSGPRRHDFISGKVLAAAPSLTDPNFRCSLVFIAEHNAQGAFGLVVNRPLGRRIREAAGEASLPDELLDLPLCLGGPCQPDRLVLALFNRQGAEGEVTCRLDLAPAEMAGAQAPGVAWLRAFAGYAGWGEGQLESELETGCWMVSDPHPALFEDRYLKHLWRLYVGRDQRWRRLVNRLPDDSGRN
jgi:putative transcriptional regulator